jgi:hypothetical protein
MLNKLDQRSFVVYDEACSSSELASTCFAKCKPILSVPATQCSPSSGSCLLMLVSQSESSDDEEPAAPVAAASSRSAKSKRKLSNASAESADEANGKLVQH